MSTLNVGNRKHFKHEKLIVLRYIIYTYLGAPQGRQVVDDRKQEAKAIVPWLVFSLARSKRSAKHVLILFFHAWLIFFRVWVVCRVTFHMGGGSERLDTGVISGCRGRARINFSSTHEPSNQPQIRWDSTHFISLVLSRCFHKLSTIRMIMVWEYGFSWWGQANINDYHWQWASKTFLLFLVEWTPCHPCRAKQKWHGKIREGFQEVDWTIRSVKTHAGLHAFMTWHQGLVDIWERG